MPGPQEYKPGPLISIHFVFFPFSANDTCTYAHGEYTHGAHASTHARTQLTHTHAVNADGEHQLRPLPAMQLYFKTSRPGVCPTR